MAARLNKRDTPAGGTTPRRKGGPLRGVLHVRPTAPLQGHHRYFPCAALAPFVEHYWIIEWNLREPRLAETLPHPTQYLVIERGAAELSGLSTRRFTRWLEGRGRVLGVKFRPGGFRPFVDRPVSDFTDRVLPLGELFGAEGARLARADTIADHGKAIARVQAFLLRRNPQPDAEAALAGRIVERIAGDCGIVRVDQIVAGFGIGTRRLQRLFREYIGAGPKWAIQRYRVHEAIDRIAAATPAEAADLALQLGYADQAHLIRDFKRQVGRSPARYLEELSQLHTRGGLDEAGVGGADTTMK